MNESFEYLVEKFEKRRVPIPGGVDYGLPVCTASFDASKHTRVIPSQCYRFSSFTPVPVDHNSKLDGLAKDFSSQPELLLLHAYLISHLRKRSRPTAVDRLFHRLWQEESQFLIENLSLRWILSAVISFGTCGENEDQRMAGTAFGMFFSLLKLTEFERTFSGFGPDEEFTLSRKVVNLPMGFSPFSLKNGDLDTNTLAQLYEIGRRNVVVQRPCEVLLSALLDDPDTIFGRLSRMRDKLANRD